MHFLEWNFEFSFTEVCDTIYDKSASVGVIAWRRAEDKSLPELTMAHLNVRPTSPQ